MWSHSWNQGSRFAPYFIIFGLPPPPDALLGQEGPGGMASPDQGWSGTADLWE